VQSYGIQEDRAPSKSKRSVSSRGSFPAATCNPETVMHPRAERNVPPFGQSAATGFNPIGR